MNQSKNRPTLRFVRGDLVEARDPVVRFLFGTGPRIVGKITLGPLAWEPGCTFLVLEGTQEASWRSNRKLYIEVLAPEGPRVAWASEFKMKNGCTSVISA